MSLKMDKKIILQEINKSTSVEELENLRIKYLGKKGIISLEMKSLSTLSNEEKKIKGKELNLIKTYFESEFQFKKDTIEKEVINSKLQQEKISLSIFCP